MVTSRMRMWRDYFESSVLLQNALDEQFRADSDLTLAEYNLLLLLHDAPDRRLRMGDLARGMVFSSSRLSYQISVLEKRGLVCRERDAHDARVIHACMTDAGKQKFDESGRSHLMAVRQLFLDDLDADEVATLEAVFGRLKTKLREPADRTRNNSNLK
ncbi:MarR family transcriptional regulator [Flexivirga endophytica]|uniref:MarR family transcriptional regulator n=1 Tax=Flexivirga endophytica TaxID=1849103 RepID=A0A916T509_9MICO|nr:MarR family winged helix-turn-helix transcriptional regulator [Flexivirga endophytica]GGB31075.1 MarR family transcriptional regulator [Flexivirga endophytica]GHB52030.1 MarR family transcriptional regulator [Flexivirga endophytica]